MHGPSVTTAPTSDPADADAPTVAPGGGASPAGDAPPRSAPGEGSRPDTPELLGPDSIMWDVTGNTMGLATTASAFVLQVMHPTIGAAVERHSVYRTDPQGRAQRSLDSVMLWIYGGQAAIEEGERLRRLHAPIKGTDEQGRRYSALNAEAYTWVHGTAFAATVTSWPYVKGRPMTDAEQDQLYEEILKLGDILQVPRRFMPPTREAYWAYYEEMIRDRLEPHAVARYLVGDGLHLPAPSFVPRALRPLWTPVEQTVAHLAYLMTVGFMPADAREKLGLAWTARQDRELALMFAIARPVHRRLPERLRYFPLAAAARRKARELAKIRGRALSSFV
ncbi:MAG: oxygenase MpaB family protein [Solirubrobacteraceae bacterium]